MTFRLLALLLILPALAQAEGLRVCTWNVQKGEDIRHVLDEIKRSPLSECGITAFQEVLTGEEGGQGKLIAKALSGEMAKSGRDIIVSRLPMLDSGELELREGRKAAWADIKLESGQTLRFYGVHLTYKIGLNPFITEVRDQEMAKLLEHASSFKGPVVVAGDFNTVGWFICCHRSAPLLSRLKAAGYQEVPIRGSTQRFGGLVDWIFVKGLAVKSSRLGGYAGSDHRWLMAETAPKK